MRRPGSTSSSTTPVTSPAPRLLSSLILRSWKRVVAVNLMGMLEASRQALPYLRRADKGRIVNLGSLAGKEGLRNLSVYSAASAGVIAFTKALGRELADTPIRVNCVAPGPIDTDLIRDLGPGTVDAMIAASPMKRLGTVGEAAELILWLCSDACSFSTGAVFDLSGGPGRVIRARIERFQATWTRFAVEKRSKKQDKESIPRPGNGSRLANRSPMAHIQPRLV